MRHTMFAQPVSSVSNLPVRTIHRAQLRFARLRGGAAAGPLYPEPAAPRRGDTAHSCRTLLDGEALVPLPTIITHSMFDLGFACDEQ